MPVVPNPGCGSKLLIEMFEGYRFSVLLHVYLLRITGSKTNNLYILADSDGVWNTSLSFHLIPLIYSNVNLAYFFTHYGKLIHVFVIGLFVMRHQFSFLSSWPHVRILSPSGEFEYAQTVTVDKVSFILTGPYNIQSHGLHFYVPRLGPTSHNSYKILL